MKDTSPHYPSHLIRPEEKDRDWILQYCKAAWNDFYQSRNDILYNNRHHYTILRDYAHGRQSINKYKPIMGVDEEDDSTWLNIDWSVIPIFTKFRDMALARTNRLEYNIIATPIDPMAVSETEDYFRQMKAKVMMRQQIEELAPGMSDLTPAARLEGEPESLEELEMQRKYSYKHNMAVEMEQAIELVLFQNKFTEIRKRVKEDVFDFGIGGYKEYVDSNGSIKVRKVEPYNLIVSHCINRDFSDAQHIGEVVEMSISDLKQMAGNQFSEEQYEDIAKNYLGMHGNPKTFPSRRAFSQGYDDFKIRVMDLEFFSVNTMVHTVRNDRRGNKIVRRDDYMRGINGGGADKIRRTDYKVVYRAMWVINTNYMFNYGLATNMKRARSRLMDTTLSYHIFAPSFHEMRIRSKTEDAIPIIDNLQLAWYKLQQVMAEARPKGIMIEIGALQDVPLGDGGQTLTPKDILDLYYQKGILVYRKEDMAGNMSNFKPIEELENGIGDSAARWFEMIQANIQLLRDVTGLNELTDGSTPDPRTLTTIAKMADENTNSSLSPIVDADLALLSSLAESLVLRIQSVVKGRPPKGYIQALGDNSMKFIEVSPQVSAHEFGIKLENKPQDYERQELIEAAKAFANEGLIEFEDLVTIKNTPNLKQAEQLLSYRIAKRKEEREEEAMRQQQMNGQIQQQSAVVAQQAEQQTKQLEHQLEMVRMEAEYQFKMAIERMKQEFETQRESFREELRAGTQLTKIAAEAQSEEPEEVER